MKPNGYGAVGTYKPGDRVKRTDDGRKGTVTPMVNTPTPTGTTEVPVAWDDGGHGTANEMYLLLIGSAIEGDVSTYTEAGDGEGYDSLPPELQELEGIMREQADKDGEATEMSAELEAMIESVLEEAGAAGDQDSNEEGDDEPAEDDGEGNDDDDSNSDSEGEQESDDDSDDEKDGEGDPPPFEVKPQMVLRNINTGRFLLVCGEFERISNKGRVKEIAPCLYLGEDGKGGFEFARYELPREEATEANYIEEEVL